MEHNLNLVNLHEIIGVFFRASDRRGCEVNREDSCDI